MTSGEVPHAAVPKSRVPGPFPPTPQAGLSWTTILAKRPAYRAAFHGFDPERSAVLPGSARAPPPAQTRVPTPSQGGGDDERRRGPADAARQRGGEAPGQARERP